MTEIIPPKPRQWARAVDNGDFICIATYSGYRTSAWDPQGAQHFFLPDVSDELLGAAALDALSRSRFLDEDEIAAFFDYRETDRRYAEWIKDLIERYSYKTKRALFKKMKSCAIESVEGTITIRPSNHEKLEVWTGEGIDDEDYVVISATGSATELGAALRLAFSRCI
jgi:hypothetical protein